MKSGDSGDCKAVVSPALCAGVQSCWNVKYLSDICLTAGNMSSRQNIVVPHCERELYLPLHPVPQTLIYGIFCMLLWNLLKKVGY